MPIFINNELSPIPSDFPALAKPWGEWKVLASSAAPVAHTGNTSETIVATVKIPAGAMGRNGILRISADWTVPSSANNKTPRIRLGGIAGTLFAGLAYTTVTNVFFRSLIRNRNAQNAQVCSTDRSRAVDVVSSYEMLTAAVDTSIEKDLVFTAQLASAAETITLEAYLVELCHQD